MTNQLENTDKEIPVKLNIIKKRIRSTIGLLKAF